MIYRRALSFGRNSVPRVTDAKALFVEAVALIGPKSDPPATP